jgi:hypothetical protein
LTKKKKKKKIKDDLTNPEKETDENVSSEQLTTKEKKNKSVAFATESTEVKAKKGILLFNFNFI